MRSEPCYHWYSLVSRRAGHSIWVWGLYDLVTSEMQLHLQVWLPGGTTPPTQDHWTWNFGSSVCIGFDMAVGRREPREVQGWVCECWRVMGWRAVFCCRDWGEPTLPTRPYVVLELSHSPTSDRSVGQLSSHPSLSSLLSPVLRQCRTDSNPMCFFLYFLFIPSRNILPLCR